jgi:hypothetical protein
MATNTNSKRNGKANTAAAPANSTPVTATPAPVVAPAGLALLAHPAAYASAPTPKAKGTTVAAWRAPGAACMGNATPGKCQHVWQWCHTQHAAGKPVSAALYGAAYPSANATNTQIEVGLWARTNGVALPRAPRKASVTQVAQPQA